MRPSLNLVHLLFSTRDVEGSADSTFARGGAHFVLEPGDEIVIARWSITRIWYPGRSCAVRQVRLCAGPLTDDGRLNLSTLDTLINERTKCVSIVHQSNILGTINDVVVIGEHAGPRQEPVRGGRMSVDSAYAC